MPRVLVNAFVCFAAALLVSCAGSSGPLGGPYREPSVVQFTFQAVTPETVRIAPDGNVTWQSLAEEVRGFVIFPASIASSFRCSDLEPYFVRMREVYRSNEVRMEESELVQLPCALAPGSYDYEIWLIDAGLDSGFDVDRFGGVRPQKILRGKIVVE
jgi:hypothetical protein